MKYIIVVFLLIVSVSSYGQLQPCTFKTYKLIDNYWDKEPLSSEGTSSISKIMVIRSENEILFYEYFKHPSEYLFKLVIYDLDNQIKNLHKKKALKNAIKEGINLKGQFVTYQYDDLKLFIKSFPYSFDKNFPMKIHNVDIVLKPLNSGEFLYNIFIENGLGFAILI